MSAMSTAPQLTPNPNGNRSKSAHPFRSSVLRGLGVVFPPLLTILIFVWVINTTYQYVFEPVTYAVREAVVLVLADVRTDLKPAEPNQPTVLAEGVVYRRLENGTFVPEAVYDKVARTRGEDSMPQTAWGIYRRYVEATFLRTYYAIPFFLAVFILVLYLLGKFMAAGIGAFFWKQFERLIHRLPLISNVYGSVKQVTDFLFSERDIQYNRVVAVEYPRKGIWSLGFVTGESMADIWAAANEPVLAVLIPTSPMPVTGFTVNVLRSEAIDLNLTVDQAIQFIVSCGVVVPPHQLCPAGDAAAPPDFPDAAPETPGGTVGRPDAPAPPNVPPAVPPAPATSPPVKSAADHPPALEPPAAPSSQRRS